tara:strand:- start:2763 stop:4478 length:1716 start_codon:yes stop_codon:yes gene_type:complete
VDVGQQSIWEQQLVDLSNVDTIAQALDLDKSVAQILVRRGIQTVEEARRFLCPSLDQLHDPFLLPDAATVVDRLLVAVERNERIAIHGDYDVDGVTATVLIRRVLHLIGADVIHYIPHRLTDGYGLQISGIDRLHQEGAKVVVTVDCGVRSLNAAKRARELGIDLIVTDHHEPGDVLPDALGVINPRRQDSNYPCRDLSGAGIALKLAQGICTRLNRSEWMPGLTKIAAIGTVADVVRLRGENRVIAKLGLDALTVGRHTRGLQALLEVSKLDGKRVTSEDVGFRLAPRLNAAGRLSSAELAAQLLLSTETSSAQTCAALAKELDDLNAQRRELERDGTQSVYASLGGSERPCYVVWSADWHRGVIGIMASRLAERYRRPAIVIAVEGDDAYGSGRSIPGFDLLSALDNCSDLLIQYGGHRQAIGLRLRNRSIEAFRQQFEKYVGDRVVMADCAPRLHFDAEIEFGAITQKFVRDMQQLEPFGNGHSRPVFVTSGVQVVDGPHVVKSEHLRMTLGQGGKRFQAIAWGAASEIGRFASTEAKMLKVAFSVSENTFREITTTQLTIADIKEDD